MTIKEKGGRPTKEQALFRKITEEKASTIALLYERANELLKKGSLKSLTEGRQCLKAAQELEQQIARETKTAEQQQEKEEKKTAAEIDDVDEHIKQLVFKYLIGEGEDFEPYEPTPEEMELLREKRREEYAKDSKTIFCMEDEEGNLVEATWQEIEEAEAEEQEEKEKEEQQNLWQEQRKRERAEQTEQTFAALEL
jgi:hypothetical protein